MGLSVIENVLLGETIVDDVNFIGVFILTDAEINGLDISVDETTIMEEL